MSLSLISEIKSHMGFDFWYYSHFLVITFETVERKKPEGLKRNEKMKTFGVEQNKILNIKDSEVQVISVKYIST